MSADVSNHLPADSAAEESGAEDPWDLARQGARSLRHRLGFGVGDSPLLVVLGSGWAEAADALGPPTRVAAFSDLAGFVCPGVAGHGAEVRSVRVGPRTVWVMLGRVHGYEGYHPHKVVHGVRSAVLAGASQVILTNAAGGLRPDLEVGSPVLITDQLNLTGRSPLTGAEFPTGIPGRFVDMVDLYSPRFRSAATQSGLKAEGVYAGLAGPQFETPAEVRMLASLGADLVGMSTVWEAIAARHLGAEVAGISLVTNLAAGVTGEPISHREVLEIGSAKAPALGRLLRQLVESLPLSE